MDSPLEHSDVAFMYTSEPEIYEAYQATWVAWGSASPESVKKAHQLGMHYAASMWALTAGAENLHKQKDLRDAVSKDILLEPIIVPWLWDHTYEGTPSYFGCTNNPVFRKFTVERVISAMETGADGLHIDDHLGTAGSFWHGGCFCDFCMNGFTDFLKKPSYEEELKNHNINIDNFNYREFLLTKVSSREEYLRKRGELPLVELYQTFQVKAAAEFVLELRNIAEKVKGSKITCSANTGIPNPMHLVVTPNLTHCVCEVEFRHNNKNAPQSSPISAFKVADAIGKFVSATASGWNWAYAHDNNNAIGLVRLWIAESYALGHLLMVPHRKWAFTLEKGTHWYQSKPEDFAYLYKFIRKNKEFFDGYKPFSQVALIFCNKSIRHHGLSFFQELCKELADTNVCFEVVIAGDDWIIDHLELEILKQFEMLIIPEPSELSESQKNTLRDWETEKNRNVSYVKSINDIKNLVEPSIVVKDAPNVWVLPRINKDKPTVFHILNRNYDDKSDKVIPIKDLEIVIKPPIFSGNSIDSINLLSPDEIPNQLTFNIIEKELHIRISELGIWSLLIIK